MQEVTHGYRRSCSLQPRTNDRSRAGTTSFTHKARPAIGLALLLAGAAPLGANLLAAAHVSVRRTNSKRQAALRWLGSLPLRRPLDLDKENIMRTHVDVLIVGGGQAGLSVS